MKKVVLYCLLLITGVTLAQNDEAYVDQLTKEFTENLANRGITDYFVIKRHCSGTIEMFKIGDKMCSSKGSYFKVFVVWMEEDKAMIKKMDNCGLYFSSELESTALWDYYVEHRGTIGMEEVKPYESTSFTGVPELRKKVQPCFNQLGFPSGLSFVNKKYNLFDISNDSDGANKNFDHNNGLKLVQLDKLIDEVLEEKEAKMKRQL